MRLGVNIDHAATIRQARFSTKLNILDALNACTNAGADSIVAHLREDRRHIQDSDVKLIRKNCRILFNLEMSINSSIVSLACKLLPDRCTLVPEKRRELTTEGGLDVFNNKGSIKKVADKLHSSGIKVSLFIDPVTRQIQASKDIGCEMIELHTGRYADAKNKSLRVQSLRQIQQAASFAKAIGLKVFAGHGLDYDNVRQIADIKHIEELNIGYSIICRALFVGIENAVLQMKELINRK